MRPPQTESLQAQRLRLSGRVQGVGFRPFVYRIALELGLCGWVCNQSGEVEIQIQGSSKQLELFIKSLLEKAPVTARPELLAQAPAPLEETSGFRILPSKQSQHGQIHLPPDLFTCDDCLRELQDPEERRYRYPFINCTQCGPRYSIIRKLPYDRPNTSMADFPLCPSCDREYSDPMDRRFHAQPLACPECGPHLTFVQGKTHIEENEAALGACIQALKEGKIVAVKGIGGYHLICDAGNESALERLRQSKPRPHKPLALMFPWKGEDGLNLVRTACHLSMEEAQLLTAPERPIVLLQRRLDCDLPPSIAPGLDEIGIMLPYSPLHHLLLAQFGAPLVATSGNPSGEPILTSPEQVEQRLSHAASAFLHHNRPILRPVDDSLFRTIRGKPRPLRLGRGLAPVELRLPGKLKQPLLAVGGQMKNCIALAWGEQIVISPHIGEMHTPRSQQLFQRLIEDLQALYQVRIQQVVCDAHPGYSPSRWARESGLPLIEVHHHLAHASALAGEHDLEGPWLLFTWDGVGLGADGRLWGGETLFGHPGDWQRVATMRPFKPIGGDRAAREPWRSATALCWESDRVWPTENLDQLTDQDIQLGRQAWSQGIHCPQTSAVGRLFDAAASLTGLLHHASYEGQGPMLLEAAANSSQDKTLIPLPLTQQPEGLWQSDWQPLLQELLRPDLTPIDKAARLHHSLAHNILQQAMAFQDMYGDFKVGLTGGVFQNRLLTEQACTLLEEAGFDVRLNERIPANDAGLSYGQVIEALCINAS